MEREKKNIITTGMRLFALTEVFTTRHWYEPDIMSDSMVSRWCGQFTEGRTNVHDVERSGRTSLVTPKVMESLRQVVLHNRHGASKFQKSDGYKNFAIGVRQYQCRHFLLALCNNYCRHKTETALHCSHIFYKFAFFSEIIYFALKHTCGNSRYEYCYFRYWYRRIDDLSLLSLRRKIYDL